MEDLSCLGQKDHIVEQGLTVYVGNTEGHLWLVINEDDGAVLRVQKFDFHAGPP
jgi:hypothetical protein